MSSVYEVLSAEFEVTAYFYNPNIMPAEEYIVRLNELTSYSRQREFPLIIEEPDIKYLLKKGGKNYEDLVLG